MGCHYIEKIDRGKVIVLGGGRKQETTKEHLRNRKCQQSQRLGIIWQSVCVDDGACVKTCLSGRFCGSRGCEQRQWDKLSSISHCRYSGLASTNSPIMKWLCATEGSGSYISPLSNYSPVSRSRSAERVQVNKHLPTYSTTVFCTRVQ